MQNWNDSADAKRFMNAVIAGDLATVDEMTANGFDVNVRVDGYPPLHMAVTRLMIEMLIGEGADVDAVDDNYGLTAAKYHADPSVMQERAESCAENIAHFERHKKAIARSRAAYNHITTVNYTGNAPQI